MSQTPVTICIVTYGAADDLPTCLEAVAAQNYRPLDLVIVDCDSPDESVQVARNTPTPGVPKLVVPLGENRGFAGGMNTALGHTSAPFVLLLNADATPAPDFVDRLVARRRDSPGRKVGAVTGRLVRPSTGTERRLDACGMVLLSAWRHLDRGSGEVDRGQYSEAQRVFGGTGAATLFAREALDDVALDGAVFDEDFFAWREDAELCFRLQERGWEVIYEPSALCEHRRRVVPANRAEQDPKVNYHSLKNRYLLRAYHQTGGNFVRTFLPTLIRDLMALVYVLVRERSSLPAYGWLWRHRQRIFDRRRRLMARRTSPEAVERWFRHWARPL